MSDARQNKFRMARTVFIYQRRVHAVVIHLEILQTTSFVVKCSLQYCRLSEIVAIPGHTHLVLQRLTWSMK